MTCTPSETAFFVGENESRFWKNWIKVEFLFAISLSVCFLYYFLKIVLIYLLVIKLSISFLMLVKIEQQISYLRTKIFCQKFTNIFFFKYR